MDNNELVLLRREYFDAIKLLYCPDINDIKVKEVLPKPDYIYFFPIMEGLIEKLIEEKESFQSLIETSNQDKAELELELISCNNKIQICKQLCEEARKTIEDEKASDGKTKAIIFATSEAGNVFFERDIRNIPKEYYQEIIHCLEMIEYGQKEDNSSKAKCISGNDVLSKIHEVKEFKIRVFYKILSPDCAYVFLAKTKKSDNDLYDRNVIIERKKNILGDFEYLKKAIRDENFKRQLIGKHEEIKQRILNLLHNKKRTMKG